VVKRASPFGNEGEYIEKGFNFKILTGVAVTGGSSTTKTIVTLKKKNNFRSYC
jgi:hypothetical protein